MLGGMDLSLVGLKIGLRDVARTVGICHVGVGTYVGTGNSLVGLRTAWAGRWPPSDGVVIKGAPMGCLLVLLFCKSLYRAAICARKVCFSYLVCRARVRQGLASGRLCVGRVR